MAPSVLDYFIQQVSRYPEKTAVVGDNKHLTYRQLDEASSALCALLLRRGVAPDSYVPLVTLRTPEMLIGMLAIVKAGAGYIPIDARYPEKRIQDIVTQSGSPLILASNATIALSENNFSEDIIYIDNISTSSQENITLISPSPDAIVYLIFTSGTTGKPKGVLIEHQSLLNLILWHNKQFAMDAESRSTLIAGLSFDVAQWEIWSPLLNILSTPIASIVDSKAALANVKDGDFGNAWLKMHSAGSGPFKMRVYQPHQAIVLDANPTSPGDKPQLKNIIIKNVPDPATRRLLIQQGDADIARELGADQTDTLKNQPGVKVLEIPSAEQNYLVFNTGNGANPLLNNPAFWEAARYLVDYQGITKDLLKGQYFVHQSFLPVGLPGALETNPFSYDPAKAKAILAKAGITHAAFTLDVENKPPFITIAQALQGSFAAAGVKIELLPAAGSQVYSRVRARQHQAAIRLWIPDYFDAHSNASAFAYNDGKSSTVAGLNGWQIPQLNKQTLAALAEADPAKRRALYTAMQQELQRSSPYVFIDQAKTEVVLRDNVKGYQQGLNADMVYYDRVSK